MKQGERWLVTGAAGQLGGHVTARLRAASPGPVLFACTRGGGRTVAGVHLAPVELSDLDALRRYVAACQPTHVVHVGAMTAVADAHAQPELAQRVNVDAAEALADAAAACGARFVFTSTDMVFDGERALYGEDDPVAPLSVYGRTKAEAERRIREFPNTLVVRLPLMYGLPIAPRETTFVRQLAALRAGQPLRLFADEFRTPIWLSDAADALLAVARGDATGVLHVAGPERLSRYDLLARFAELLGIANPRLTPISRREIEAAEPRPRDLSLDDARFRALFPAAAPGPIRLAALALPRP